MQYCERGAVSRSFAEEMETGVEAMFSEAVWGIDATMPDDAVVLLLSFSSGGCETSGALPITFDATSLLCVLLCFLYPF